VGTVVLLAALAGIDYVWEQARRGEQALKRDLESLANLEADVLREGDRETFLWLQDAEDAAWYASQVERAPGQDADARLEPGQELPLAVLDAALLPGGQRAWAEVAWGRDGGVYRRAQFYRLAEDRWLRSGPQKEYFGQELSYTTAHFVFSYRAADAPSVGWMARQLEDWYAALCADLDCGDDGQPIQVFVTAEPGGGGRDAPADALILRTPRLRGVREDGAPLPEERGALARTLVYRLVSRWAGKVDASRQPYLLPEFVNWELGRLGLAGEEGSPTPMLDHVIESRGLEGVRALLRAMGRTDSEGEALRLVLDPRLDGPDRFPWQRQDGLTLVQALPFKEYLAAVLALERDMRQWQSEALVADTSGPLARRIFGFLLLGRAGEWHARMADAFAGEAAGDYLNLLPPAQPTVVRYDSLDDRTVWAEVAYTDGSAGREFRRIEFFRQVDGAWRHSQPDSRFLGGLVTLESEHFQLTCHEREAEWMGRELARLEALHDEISAALGVQLAPGERLTIRITPDSRYATFHPYPDTFQMRISSPYYTGWTEDWEERHLTGPVTYWLLSRLAPQSSTGAQSAWRYAVLYAWLWQLVASDPASPEFPGYRAMRDPWIAALETGPTRTLSDLGQLTFGADAATRGWTRDDWMQLYGQMATLMLYVGENYEQDVFVALLRELPEAHSLEAWLETGLEVSPEVFEAEWKAWLRDQIG
jgi:hypothetical protein